MPIIVTAPKSELGRVVTHSLPDEQPGDDTILLNLTLQTPNTLLHDGHAWKRYRASQILARTKEVLAAPEHAKADFIVHASYAFIRAADQGAKVGDKLQPIVEAARAAEDLVLSGARPACVVRLGYLYGPESRNLKAYRTAFRLGRPYWAGPRKKLQHFLRTADAARALLQAARRRPTDRVVYAADQRPASFAAFMDRFARLIGNPLPLHIPAIGRQVAHVVVAEEHMQMVELGVEGRATPVVPGFRPVYADFQAGLQDVVETWKR
jgi:nucleoside-diphosphate-sugar epimerase